MRNPLAGARFLLSVAQSSQLPDCDRPEIAFAGRSNAGKSSALNVLCAQKGLARVSKTPGRTQLLNFFELENGRLVDLPGYGYADVPEEIRRKWGPLIGDYVKKRPCLRGIVLISDARRPLGAFDCQMIDWATAHGRPVHMLLSKADKLKPSAARATHKQVVAELGKAGAAVTAQLFSATKRTGVDEARRALAPWLNQEPST